VQTVHLTWQHSGELAVVLAVGGGAMALSTRRAVRGAGAWARETAVIAVLWGLWQLAGEVSVMGTDAAYQRARRIDGFDRDLWLPSERSVQHVILGHRLLVEGANLYYGAMHLTTMFVFLVWLFLRHRAAYPRVRAVMVGATLGCLLIQLVPVAPPRMLNGFVDTGLVYNQSVYSNGLPIDQLSAMPSMHVAWAFLIGYYVWRVSPSRWRYLGPAHACLTTFVVVATGNHWWLDGIVAVAVLVLSAWVVYGVRLAWATARARQLPVLEAFQPRWEEGATMPT
jgi:hypothetical protein